jgi:hypothetical protein
MESVGVEDVDDEEMARLIKESTSTINPRAAENKLGNWLYSMAVRTTVRRGI